MKKGHKFETNIPITVFDLRHPVKRHVSSVTVLNPKLLQMVIQVFIHCPSFFLITHLSQ